MHNSNLTNVTQRPFRQRDKVDMASNAPTQGTASRHDFGAPPLREVTPHFQPKFDFTGRLVGVEALARWHHPAHGILRAGEFLPGCDAALHEDLSLHIIDEAFRLTGPLRRFDACALPVAVNASPELIMTPGFIDWLDARRALYGLPANCVTIEILETPMINTGVRSAFADLHESGYRLSIDDFGVGASNFRRLADLPFRELKLAGEFVCGVSASRRKAAIVNHVVGMAEQLDVTVVLEGVESLEDLQWLIDRSPKRGQMQGFYLARPMAAQALEAWMEGRVALPH